MESHRDDRTGAVPARPPVAVVICTRDRADELAGALAAVESCIGPGDELIVVDSASRDVAVGRIAAGRGATVVRCERPGLSRARNAGIAASASPLVAFTDDDCRPRPGWVDALAGRFADPQVGVVAGRVEADDAGGVAVSTLSTLQARRVQGPTDPIGLMHGANMAFRRVAIEGLGGFDELLGAGSRFPAAEDHDLVFRVLAGGWTGWYEPAAVVGHRQWRSRTEALRVEYRYGVGAGAFVAKIARRHPGQGGRLLAHRLWENGVARAWHDLRAGHQTGAAVSGLKAIGVVVGALRAACVPLDGQNYRDVAAPPLGETNAESARRSVL